MMLADSPLLMVTSERAAELAGISRQKLRYWERTGLVAPSTSGRVSSTVSVRLYGYGDLLELLVISELREQVSLQHIRLVIDYLRRHQWRVSQIRFSIQGQGSEVYFQTPDGGWAGGKSPEQFVFSQVVDLEPLRARISRAGTRREGSGGSIEKRRGALASKPVIAGTRVPVAAVENFIRDGAEDAELLEAFPALVAADLKRIRDGVVA